MAGGPGKINEYNQSLTPEKRKENARKAGNTPKRKCHISDIRRIAKMINDAPANKDMQTSLAVLGLKDAHVSNAAGIALAVFQAAINGDMKAVEKWERYVGQYVKDDWKNEDDGVLPDLIAGLQDDED